MFVYTNELGSTEQLIDVDRGVITTRVGYSSAEAKQLYNEAYPLIYKEYYNSIVQQYIDAGYNPTRGGGGPSGGQLLIKNLSQIPVIGTIFSMFGGMFGGSSAPEVPYRTARQLASRYAKEETEKLVKEKEKELKTAIVESEQAQKWSGIQASRGHSALLTVPQGISIEKGRVITQVKGETVMTPTK
jgi:hypothetical protein